jgi:hypothetical protein
VLALHPDKTLTFHDRHVEVWFNNFFEVDFSYLEQKGVPRKIAGKAVSTFTGGAFVSLNDFVSKYIMWEMSLIKLLL